MAIDEEKGSPRDGLIQTVFTVLGMAGYRHV